MASGFGYALAGAAIGLGDEMVKRADEKRAMARDALKMRARSGERALDREQKLGDLEIANKREDVQRAENRGFDVEDRDIKEAGLDRRNRSRGLGRKNKPISLTSGLLSRIERRFKDRLGDTDYGIVDEVTTHTRRLIEEAKAAGKKISEDQAYNRAVGAMMYEEDVTVDPPGLFNKSTEKRFNSEGRGKFAGFDFDGDGIPDSGGPAAAPTPAGESGPVDISHVPQESLEALRADPSLRDQFDAKYGPGTAAAVLGE